MRLVKHRLGYFYRALDGAPVTGGYATAGEASAAALAALRGCTPPPGLPLAEDGSPSWLASLPQGAALGLVAMGADLDFALSPAGRLWWGNALGLTRTELGRRQLGAIDPGLCEWLWGRGQGTLWLDAGRALRLREWAAGLGGWDSGDGECPHPLVFINLEVMP